MLRRGMPMHQVSKQLGHKSVVITAKHYAHVIGDDVADSVRSLSGDMGIG
jgi:integrase